MRRTILLFWEITAGRVILTAIVRKKMCCFSLEERIQVKFLNWRITTLVTHVRALRHHNSLRLLLSLFLASQWKPHFYRTFSSKQNLQLVCKHTPTRVHLYCLYFHALPVLATAHRASSLAENCHHLPPPLVWHRSTSHPTRTSLTSPSNRQEVLGRA